MNASLREAMDPLKFKFDMAAGDRQRTKCTRYGFSSCRQGAHKNAPQTINSARAWYDLKIQYLCTNVYRSRDSRLIQFNQAYKTTFATDGRLVNDEVTGDKRREEFNSDQDSR